MSRGHGVVQRFILDYLAAGHPEPDKRSSFDFPRKRRPVLIGHPLWMIAGTYRPVRYDQLGRPVPDRSTMCSFGRAMATLRRTGLVEVRHKYGEPYLRAARRIDVRQVAPQDPVALALPGGYRPGLHGSG